ncbi:inner kinetochore subunit wip1-like [Actinia tenebrosa]|uniref:Inner kinetochore subunit wip1-like n=1 Tax=Actinia tenebrosa TaxID=6105 RepID=A0A6P8IVK2_ACTTE|nr:inner kinetochore subunit wip1-like [Actinia tenebrosa]
MKRRFPRARQKAIIKKFESKARLAKSVDILIFLDYMMFLRRLALEANVQAKENKERTIEAHHINEVLKKTLKTCRG